MAKSFTRTRDIEKGQSCEWNENEYRKNKTIS